MILIGLSAHDVDNVIFRVADALQVPVLLAALLALAFVVVECAAFAVELQRRRRRRFIALEHAAADARAAAVTGDRITAAAALERVGWSVPMAEVLGVIAYNAGLPGGEPRIAKSLADFDFGSERRLERTRLLVRAGPALGLMGTLIPLSPALTGLAQGNVSRLSENLRVAFSVTVLGLLIGAVAFGALARARPHLRAGSVRPRIRRLGDDRMIPVTPNARRREDRAGDPLDGLVNLFDLGIVLSVAFLLAALSSLHLSGALTKNAAKPGSKEIVLKPGQKVAPLPTPGPNAIGRGVPAGTVYRLDDGRLVYVQKTP